MERTTCIRRAGPADRPEIYRLRHEVYARELGQHPERADERLTDPLDDSNLYVVARSGGELVGCVSLTPPGSPRYSVDKYVARERLPFAFDDRLWEVRLLTVAQGHRSGLLAGALMYAAFRWMQAHGGQAAVILGRREVRRLYHHVGFREVGVAVTAGRCRFEVMHATLAGMAAALVPLESTLARLEERLDWRLGVPFRSPSACFHGGAFFRAVGEEFEDLSRLHGVVNADVLDAWFPPAPAVLETLAEHLPALVRTSPPTQADGLVRRIAAARGVPPECVLPGAGSSDLIFLAFRQWLRRDSRALLIDPCYGEYAHVLEKVVGCRVERLTLRREEGFALGPVRLAARLREEGHDLVVLVNPNSPTGHHVPRAALEAALREAPPTTRVWVDETYVDYAGEDASLEPFAAASENVVVVKSMSKAYALSGLRCAYLVACPHALEELRALTPPWAVSLPAQVAAVRALESAAWYRERWRETRALRESLARGLERTLGAEVVPGVANFVLLLLREDGPTAAELCAAARDRGVHLRDASGMGTTLGPFALRVAVKDEPTNARVLRVLADALEHLRRSAA